MPKEGSIRVKAVALQTRWVPPTRGSGRGHLGASHKERDSRGQESGKVSRLSGTKGTLPVYMYV